MRKNRKSKKKYLTGKTPKERNLYFWCQSLVLLWCLLLSLVCSVHATNNDTAIPQSGETVPEVAGSAQTEEVDGERGLDANAGIRATANSALADGYTYILYGYSGGIYYALGENGETLEVTLEGEEIVSKTDAVKWTYNEKQKSFCNSKGKYLTGAGWYKPLTVGDKPKVFTVSNPKGGHVETMLGGYTGCLTIFNKQIMTGKYQSPGFFFALTDIPKVPDEGEETPVPPIPQNSLGIQKYVDKLKSDDQYDLNLTVNGVYKKEGKNKADILYVVDTTGSMEYSMDGKIRDNKERWYSILRSIEYMTNLLSRNSTADIQYSMIFFNGGRGSTKDANVVQDWTKDTTEIMSVLHAKTERLGGGTNYDAACKELVEGPLVGKMRPEAERIVVFLSDGEANMYYGDDGKTVDDLSNDRLEALRRAKARLINLSGIDMFYCIGVGSDIHEKGTLEELSSVLNGKNIKTGYAHCNNTQEIEKSFDSIVHSIIQIKYDHIQVTDNLSKYAEIVEGTKLRLTVTDGQGQPVDSAEGDIAGGARLQLKKTTINEVADLYLRYDSTAKQLVLEFPKNYILEDGWQYKLTATIKPTPDAYREHAENGYPDVGEQYTGKTSSDQKGFHSNIVANLNYTLNNEKTSTMEYPKPVIQVSEKPGSRLPDTGGVGTTWLYTVGILLLVLELLSVIKKPQNKKY